MGRGEEGRSGGRGGDDSHETRTRTNAICAICGHFRGTSDRRFCKFGEQDGAGIDGALNIRERKSLSTDHFIILPRDESTTADVCGRRPTTSSPGRNSRRSRSRRLRGRTPDSLSLPSQLVSVGFTGLLFLPEATKISDGYILNQD